LASHERTVSQVPPNEELYAVSNHPEDSDNDVTSLIVNEDVPKTHVNSEVQTEADVARMCLVVAALFIVVFVW
jgi:hypothetical protein